MLKLFRVLTNATDEHALRHYSEICADKSMLYTCERCCGEIMSSGKL